MYDDAFVLPLTRLSGHAVFPVIRESQFNSWTHDQSGDFSTRIFSDDCSRPPLTLAFVSASPPKRALPDLLALSALGRTVSAIPSSRELNFFQMAEFDFRGITVIRSDAFGHPQELVEGDLGPAAASDMDPYWRCARESQVAAFAAAFGS